MASIMEQSPYSSRRQVNHHHHHHHHHQHHHEAAAASDSFNLREWALKARMISRENTNSRRFSASNIRSFREDTRSFRSNITISSTASSPGYPLISEEIDPSTYSFTTALKALQARNVYNSWECSSPDGFALNSKWNEAEKYICNPLSGEFPMECLSAKTLSARSFRNLTNTITMSAPLVYNSSNHSRNMIQTKPPVIPLQETDSARFPISEKNMEGMSTTRDVGTQSTPLKLSSATSPPSPASTPSITERSLKPCEAAGDSPNSNAKPKADEEFEVKDTREKEETKGEDNKEDQKKKISEQKSWMYSSSSSSRRRQAGCLSWMRKRQREKHKPRMKHNFFNHLKGC